VLGRAAEQGDEIEHERLRFRVDKVVGTRIQRLTVTFPPPRAEQLAAEG
jgi:CBS domain containing-hemolysin-like protein